jgi:hypothetical protein
MKVKAGEWQKLPKRVRLTMLEMAVFAQQK